MLALSQNNASKEGILFFQTDPILQNGISICPQEKTNKQGNCTHNDTQEQIPEMFLLAR